jgi:hypothetical protein
MKAETSIDQNPLIGTTPSETISHCVGALNWLNSADTVIDDAFSGTPNDEIQFGRFLLGQCVVAALNHARNEVEVKGDTSGRLGN